MIKFKSNEEGKCPKCNGVLCYGEVNINDANKVYMSCEWECVDCHACGEEYFTLSFAGHNYLDEETGKDIQITPDMIEE